MQQDGSESHAIHHPQSAERTSILEEPVTRRALYTYVFQKGRMTLQEIREWEDGMHEQETIHPIQRDVFEIQKQPSDHVWIVRETSPSPAESAWIIEVTRTCPVCAVAKESTPVGSHQKTELETDNTISEPRREEEPKTVTIKEEVDIIEKRLNDGDCGNLTVQEMAQVAVAELIARANITVADLQEIARLMHYCEQGYTMNTEHIEQIISRAQMKHNEKYAGNETKPQEDSPNDSIDKREVIKNAALGVVSIVANVGGMGGAIIGSMEAYGELAVHYPTIVPYNGEQTLALVAVGGIIMWWYAIRMWDARGKKILGRWVELYGKAIAGTFMD